MRCEVAVGVHEAAARRRAPGSRRTGTSRADRRRILAHVPVAPFDRARWTARDVRDVTSTGLGAPASMLPGDAPTCKRAGGVGVAPVFVVNSSPCPSADHSHHRAVRHATPFHRSARRLVGRSRRSSRAISTHDPTFRDDLRLLRRRRRPRRLVSSATGASASSVRGSTARSSAVRRRRQRYYRSRSYRGGGLASAQL